MTDDCIEKNQSDTEQFQKYPKVYQENKHYKSVKEKLMTAYDDQDIIKFPSKTNTFSSVKMFQSLQTSKTYKKTLKYQGRNFQIVPIRTISYSAPVDGNIRKQQVKFSKNQQKEIEKNIFHSKNICSNMKKLKDLRKTNYKNHRIQNQKKAISQRQYQSEQKLDLFRLTSTNFQYSKRVILEGQQTFQFLRKLNQTQATNRNKINFPKKSIPISGQTKSIKAKHSLSKQNYQKDKGLANFQKMVPIQNKNQKSLSKKKQAIMGHFSSTKQISQNKKTYEDLKFQSEDESLSQGYLNSFVRYSQSQLEYESQRIDKAAKRLKGSPKQINQKQEKRIEPNHINYSFKGSFKIKHLDDNKHILLGAIKKKANTMDKDQFIRYLKKVIH